MESVKWWARHGEAVRHALEVGALVPLETAREEFPEAFFLCALESGRLRSWAEAFPDPRGEPAIGREVLGPAPLAGRWAGLYSLRNTGDGVRSARVWGAVGASGEGLDPAQGGSGRGPSADQLCSGAGVRPRWVKLAQPGDLRQPVPRPPQAPRVRWSKAASAPRAARSSRRGMQPRPQAERFRAPLPGARGRPSQWGSPCGSMPGWVGAAGATCWRRPTWRGPSSRGQRRGGG